MMKNESYQNNTPIDVDVMTADIPPLSQGNKSLSQDIDPPLVETPAFVSLDINLDHCSLQNNEDGKMMAITSRRSSVVSDVTTSRRSSVNSDIVPVTPPGGLPTPFKTSSNSAFTRKVSVTDTYVPPTFTREISTDTSVPFTGITAAAHHEEPMESFNVMKSYCMQQRMISHFTEGLTVSVPSGTLGISLASDNDGTVVKEVRESSVLANQVCPGDRILSVDGEDVRQMYETEISTMLALWHNEHDRKIEIKPSLASTMPFLASNCSHIHSNYKSQLIYNGVRTYIITHRMSYNEVRVLLQQSISVLSKRVGGRLIEIQEEESNIWSEAKKHIAHWFTSILDCDCQPSYDVSAASNDQHRGQPPAKRRCLRWVPPINASTKATEIGTQKRRRTRTRRRRRGAPINASTKDTEIRTH